VSVSNWSSLELVPTPRRGVAPGGAAGDIAALRKHIRDAEIAVMELNRQITDAIVTKRPTGDLSQEMVEIIEVRDFMKARLARLEGANGG
jgi:hypothetical protein